MPYLNKVMLNSALSKDEAEKAMEIMIDDADPHQSAAFLSILRFRGESVEEIVGLVAALQKKAVPVHVPFPIMDMAGTGGDFARTVNISTGSAILAAACGVPFAKHGNRSVSSLSGSADVLEALEIDIEANPNEVKHYLQHAGIAFMFAPNYHPAMKKLRAVRRGLQIPTAINFLGTLLNPAKAEYAIIGLADPSSLDLMSQVIMQQSYRKRTLLFHGCGIDELTSLGKIKAYDIHEGQRHYLEIGPTALGFAACSLKDLQGGDAAVNARLLLEVFEGKKNGIADALIITAGAAVWIFGKASTLQEGTFIARKALQEGGALDILNQWKTLSKQVNLQRRAIC